MTMRVAAGLSQRQVAAVLRLPHSWVAKVESGERRLDLVEFGWFCAACGASPAREAAGFFQQKPRRSGAPGIISSSESRRRERK